MISNRSFDYGSSAISHPRLTGLRHLVVLASVALVGACSNIPLESPICTPLRPVLVDLSIVDQLAIRENVPQGQDVLLTISTNDLELKSHVRLLEGLIDAHDEPLSGCD